MDYIHKKNNRIGPIGDNPEVSIKPYLIAAIGPTIIFIWGWIVAFKMFKKN
ncbi:hypothetical protein [Psychrobacillus sp. L3]|uniref:hypothetical protein n=1 Tax=Psychrobacillus sp. L3 TaxID=3236891 RepID=UPI0036F42353